MTYRLKRPLINGSHTDQLAQIKSHIIQHIQELEYILNQIDNSFTNITDEIRRDQKDISEKLDRINERVAQLHNVSPLSVVDEEENQEEKTEEEL